MEPFRSGVYNRGMKKRLLGIIFSLTAFLCFAGEPFFFVQLTDTHFGQGDHFERAEAAVKRINALPVDIAFVAVTGDIVHDRITDEKLVDRVLQVMDQLDAPVHFVPGNHDLLKSDPAGTVAAFTNRFGPLISSAEYHGVQCLFVCTEPLAGGVEVEGFDPLTEAESLLSDGPALVFHHIPSSDDFYNNRMHGGWGETDAGRQWKELLGRHSVKAVFAGHFHRDELLDVGGIPLFVAPPLSGRLGRQAAFRIYEYRDGQILYRTQYFN